MTLDPKLVAEKLFLDELPKMKEAWKIISHDGYIFAANIEAEPLVLHKDGWKKIDLSNIDESDPRMQKLIANIRRESVLSLSRPSVPKKRFTRR